jgi:hypothetical protein
VSWKESGDPGTTWDEHEPIAPAAGAEEVVAGDEWHDLWFGGFDFWPWSRAGSKTTTWKENS